MPTLTNHRHEAFAQNLALGKPQTTAYIDAGYAANGAQPNSARLILNDMVSARLEELQSQNRARNEQDLDTMLAHLERARRGAMALGQSSAAVQAIMAKAKLLGYI